MDLLVKNLRNFGKFIAPWCSNERICLFIATDVIPCEQNLDEDEILTPHLIAFDNAMAMIESGEIQDATTMIGIKMASPLWKMRKNS